MDLLFQNKGLDQGKSGTDGEEWRPVTRQSTFARLTRSLGHGTKRS
jgi:hypothetical protein